MSDRLEITDADVANAVNAHMAVLAEQDHAAGRPAPKNPRLSDIPPEQQKELMDAMRHAITAALGRKELNG